jgi:threonine/homoserine/homoserine lactone efflux protein
VLDGIIKSFVFGVTIALAIGPIALLIINYGISAGLRPAAAAGLGAALADLTYALVSFTIGSLVLARLVEHRQVLRLASSLVLVALGLYLIARAVRTSRGTALPEARGDATRPLATTYLLTLFNPLTIVFFTTFAAQLPLATSRIAAVPFALSVALGSLTVSLLLALGGTTLSRLISRPAWIRALNVASGAAIAVFGIVGLLRSL